MSTQLHHTLEVTPDGLDVSVFALATTTKPSFLASRDSLTTSLPSLFIPLVLLVVDGCEALAATQGVAVRVEPTHRLGAGDGFSLSRVIAPCGFLRFFGSFDGVEFFHSEGVPPPHEALVRASRVYR